MSTTRKDWLKWVAVTCALVATASAEYALARACGVPSYVAWTVPGALDAYLLRALQAQREVFTAVLAVIGVNVLSHLVHASMLPVEWWTITVVGAVPALVLYRVHALRTPAEARLDLIHGVPASTCTDVHGCSCSVNDPASTCSYCASAPVLFVPAADDVPVMCVHDRPVSGTCWECDRAHRFPVADPVPGWDDTVTFDEHVSSVPVPVPDYVPAAWGPSVYRSSCPSCLHDRHTAACTAAVLTDGHGSCGCVHDTAAEQARMAVPVLEDDDCLDPDGCTADEPCPRCEHETDTDTGTCLPLPAGFKHASTPVLTERARALLPQARQLHADGVTGFRAWKEALGAGTPIVRALMEYTANEHASTEGDTP